MTRASLAALFLVCCGLGISGCRRPSPAETGDEARNAGRESPPAPPAIPFTDVTAAAGIAFEHENGSRGEKLLPETMGSGAAFFDYDGDGDQDLLLVNSCPWPYDEPSGPPPTQALYRNDGPFRFTEVTAAAGLDLSFFGMGVAAGDYDGDGDPDLFLTGVGENHLLRNDGGRFRDVTAAAGLASPPGDWSTGAAFFDADGDRDLDLVVVSYVLWSREIDHLLDFRLDGIGRAFGPPQSYQGTVPRFYRNHGGGRFREMAKAAGLHLVSASGAGLAKSLAVLPVDADRDGRLDLLVANDTVPKFFFHNRGGGIFEEVGESWGLAYNGSGAATGAMGLDAGVLRADGKLAFVVGNFSDEMSSLFVAQEDPTFFVDHAMLSGIGAASRRSLTFGVLFFDADLDGRLDLLLANGHIEDAIAKAAPGQSWRQAAQLFWNRGDSLSSGHQNSLSSGHPFSLVELPAAGLGDLARPIVGRGAAYADLDGDGDLDLLLTENGGRPLLLRNDQQTGHHFVRILLADRPPAGEAIGARVELTAGGQLQVREVMPTRGYLSQVERTLTFGLGKATSIDRLEVVWPGGERQQVPPPAIDRVVEIARPPGR